MHLLIVPGSLSATSQSHALARKATEYVPENIETTFLNPKDLDIQFCDGREWGSYNDDTTTLQEAFKTADAYLFSVPVYNWSYSGVFKNMIDLVPPGEMGGTVAGLMAKGGGEKGFLMMQRELRSLLTYFNIHTIPETVYASNADFDGEQITNTSIEDRIESLVETTVRTRERLGETTDQGI
ncbi:MAG: NAD(P)H-dependent oxidoreductase [Candidatus Nanohaloarchaeota archaeon QJJ-5]|nr:NAD(P)H-dependent oxidoreductase [Candidatus Nanohaloarchaeota archaeon QJJ-5]